MGATSALTQRSHACRYAAPSCSAPLSSTRERFADADGRVRATFEIVSLSGWAPHDSQQKPLRPGSARTRLADALNVDERPAGEKAGG